MERPSRRPSLCPLGCIMVLRRRGRLVMPGQADAVLCVALSSSTEFITPFYPLLNSALHHFSSFTEVILMSAWTHRSTLHFNWSLISAISYCKWHLSITENEGGVQGEVLVDFRTSREGTCWLEDSRRKSIRTSRYQEEELCRVQDIRRGSMWT